MLPCVEEDAKHSFSFNLVSFLHHFRSLQSFLPLTKLNASSKQASIIHCLKRIQWIPIPSYCPALSSKLIALPEDITIVGGSNASDISTGQSGPTMRQVGNRGQLRACCLWTDVPRQRLKKKKKYNMLFGFKWSQYERIKDKAPLQWAVQVNSSKMC